MPTFLAIALATFSLSPVSMMVLMFLLCSSSMASLELSFKLSCTAYSANICLSSERQRTVLPFSSSSLTI